MSRHQILLAWYWAGFYTPGDILSSKMLTNIIRFMYQNPLNRVVYGIIICMVDLRPALESDFSAIRALIYKVRINPLDLDWQRFVVAVTPGGDLVGCGQVKPHGDGSLELASIAVEPAYRGQGVAREIIERLIAAYPGDLYLTCRSRLGPLYEKFGFRRVEESAMPRYFRKISRMARIFGRTGLMPRDLWVMRRDGGGPV